jgi:adenine phosphoribosyltransferase
MLFWWYQKNFFVHFQQKNIFLFKNKLFKNMNEEKVAEVKRAIRDVPDFPKPGILFKDITTALKKPELFHYIVDYFYEQYKNMGITKVACIESRGFIIGGALAYRLHAGFVPIRKPGKLPAHVYSVEYELEYGFDSLEVHTDAFTSDDIVLIHDDLLATGGTAKASYELLQKFQVSQIQFSFLCELSFLNGRDIIGDFGDIKSMFKF